MLTKVSHTTNYHLLMLSDKIPIKKRWSLIYKRVINVVGNINLKVFNTKVFKSNPRWFLFYLVFVYNFGTQTVLFGTEWSLSELNLKKSYSFIKLILLKFFKILYLLVVALFFWLLWLGIIVIWLRKNLKSYWTYLKVFYSVTQSIQLNFIKKENCKNDRISVCFI
jgi:hypothetical protein